MFNVASIECIWQTESDFDCKPMVMLLGQYSTGKTTFIKHLLRGEYPGKTSVNRVCLSVEIVASLQ